MNLGGHVPFGPRHGMAWLLPAALVLLFSNGRWQIALAALSAPFFVRMFLLGQPLGRALVLGSIIHVAAHLVMWIGIIPAPGWLYIAISAAYGIIYFLPFCIDRLAFPHLSGIKSTLVLPLSWFVTEILLQWLTPYGSWASLGYTQSGTAALMQVTSVVGIAGVGFLVVWLASFVSWLLVSKAGAGSKWRYATILVLAVGVIPAVGMIRLERVPEPERRVRVGMVLPTTELIHALNRSLSQGSSNMVSEEARELARQVNDDLLDRSRQASEAGAQIVVWSELAGRVFKEDETALLRRGGILAAQSRLYLLMSIGTWNPAGDPPLENKTVLIDPAGEIVWQHQKARPIVGAEAHLLPAAHDTIRVLDTPHGRLSAVICHDLDFPDLIRKAGSQDVQLLFGPSADWEVIQDIHAGMAAVRALENGLTLVRPTQSGLSLVADPYGRRLFQSMDSASGGHNVVVEVPVYRLQTGYTRIGGVLPWLAGLGLAVLLAIALKNARRS